MIENNLQETYKKFDIFLEKLKKRAEEIAIDGQETVQEVYDSDDDLYKRAFWSFKKGLEGKFQEIISKGENIYKTKVIPEEQNFGDGSLNLNVEKKFEKWKDSINYLKESIFRDLKEKTSKDYYEEVKKEFEEIKDNFFCTNCGAKIELEQFYTISKYITCSFCKTKNIFHPSDKMRELQFMSGNFPEKMKL
ncbi:hypothetical protein HXK64_03180 [Candidatus Gracilibacteria bacterium]|nr:hypothetical protein [Candidatus Gracilibacteria bacterium]